jgi:UDPglucose 6-dehydrogenase
MKIKNICCIGAGYVGGPTMAVIALKCPDIKVTLVDNSEKQIQKWNGSLENLPVFEPGLKEIVKETRGKNLFFSNEIDKNIDDADLIFIAVNTPTKKKGKGAGMAADLTNVISCAKQISRASNSSKIIVEKSTLPVRTAEKLKEILHKNKKGVKFDVLSNPEFLAEGTAINDLFKSDRVLIGAENTRSGKRALQKLKKIYARWIPINKIITTNVWSSELVKLASNAMLAQRISSVNSLSAVCEKTGADIEEVSNAIGMDKRIGKHFLKSSVGFGGSCFQKDILNLVYLCRYYGLKDVAEYWHQVVKINNYQRNRFADKIIDDCKINKSKVAVLGWSFKKDTNDSRESSSIHITKKLIDNNFQVNIYDPKVTKERIVSDLLELYKEDNTPKMVIDKNLSIIKIHNNINDAISNNLGVAILTEWDEFINFDWIKFSNTLKDKLTLYDGRNILNNINFKNSKIIYKSLDKNGKNLF